MPRVRVPEAHRPPALWSVLSAVRLAASCPAALGLLSPPCTGQTVCLHVELGSSCPMAFLPWVPLSPLESVGCPFPPQVPWQLSASAWRDRACQLLQGNARGRALTHGPGWLL